MVWVRRAPYRACRASAGGRSAVSGTERRIGHGAPYRAWRMERARCARKSKVFGGVETRPLHGRRIASFTRGSRASARSCLVQGAVCVRREEHGRHDGRLRGSYVALRTETEESCARSRSGRTSTCAPLRIIQWRDELARRDETRSRQDESSHRRDAASVSEMRLKSNVWDRQVVP